MPEREFITGIPGVKVRAIFEGNAEIRVKADAVVPLGLVCPRCGSGEHRTKATRRREFKHAILSRKLVVLELYIPKRFCRRCRCYFMVRVPGILPKKRATDNLRLDTFELHHGGIAGSQLARTNHVSSSTVER